MFIFMGLSSLTSDARIIFQQATVYYGNCTLYHRELRSDNKVHYRVISTGTGKVVINRSAKTFYFYYNGKLVFNYKGYENYADNQQGGEGFTFDASSDAHRLSAERSFNFNTGMVMGGDMGYNFEITNYQTAQ